MKTLHARLTVLGCVLLMASGCQHVAWINPPAAPDFRVQYHSFDTRPTPADAERLAAFAEEAALDGTLHFEVVGHAYERRQSGHNFAMGKRRAEVVAEQLIAAGVPPERITARSAGDTEPSISYENFGKRRKFNRVEIFRTVVAE